MNLAELKAVVAAYHAVEVASLTKNGVDLFLVAANNARKKAEKRHDFEYTRLTASMVLDGVNGGAFSDATVSPSGTFSGLKEVVTVSALIQGGRYTPLPFTRADVSIEEIRTERELGGTDWNDLRYPSDAQFLYWLGQAGIVQRGNRLYRYPRVPPGDSEATPFTIYIEGYGWLNNYTDDQIAAGLDATPQDFMLEYGYEWMQWEIVMTLNFWLHTFVQRQENNVGSPQALRDEAWHDLVLWDSYLVDPNTTRER